MDKKFQIRYLPSFYNDLNKIIKYIVYKLNNTTAAQNLLNEIEQEIENRKQNPNSYEKYNSNRARKDTYYRIYVKNYVIFYVVKENIMEVRRILYSKRNFEELI